MNAATNNHNAPMSVALEPKELRERQVDLAVLLRASLVKAASDLLLDVRYMRGPFTSDERQWLKDAARNRKAYTDDNAVTFLKLQARIEGHFLSEEMRAIETRLSPAPALCLHEASEAEQQANEALNMAQLVAAREPTPTRVQQVREWAMKQLDATRRLIDVTSHSMRRA